MLDEFKMNPSLRNLTLWLACCFLLQESQGQETLPNRPQIAVSTESKPKIKQGSKIAIILTGNDNVLTKLVEDSISIQLANAGFEIFSREQVELALAKRLTTKSEQGAESAVGTLDLAKSLNAELVVTGGAVVVLQDTQPVLIKAVSLQVLDGLTGKFLVQTLFESKDGLRLTEVARSFLDVLNPTKK